MSKDTTIISDLRSFFSENENNWVKGTKNGNTITVAARQPIAYDEEYATTLSLRWGIIDLEGNFKAADDIADVFTFEIEDGVISLQGTTADEDGKESQFMGIRLSRCHPRSTLYIRPHSRGQHRRFQSNRPQRRRFHMAVRGRLWHLLCLQFRKRWRRLPHQSAHPSARGQELLHDCQCW